MLPDLPPDIRQAINRAQPRPLTVCADVRGGLTDLTAAHCDSHCAGVKNPHAAEQNCPPASDACSTESTRVRACVSVCLRACVCVRDICMCHIYIQPSRVQTILFVLIVLIFFFNDLHTNRLEI